MSEEGTSSEDNTLFSCSVIGDVVMDGFKCYEEPLAVRSLDRNFSAITGLNGSGKSNIIDAIMFALDLGSSKMMRAGSLKELINIHRKDCMVTVVFDNQDKASSPAGYEHYDSFSVSRSLDSDGKSKFKINNHCCTKGTIEKMCRSAGITNDFIVMQGQITKILNMKSDELRNMIEEVAGTRGYSMEEKKAKEELVKKEQKLKEIRKHLEMSISPYTEKMQAEKKVYEENKDFEKRKEKASKELEVLGSVLWMASWSKKMASLHSLLEDYTQDKSELDEIEAALERSGCRSPAVDVVELKTRLNSERLRVDELSSKAIEESLNSKINELDRCKEKMKGITQTKALLEQERILSQEMRNGLGATNTAELEMLGRRLASLEAETAGLRRKLRERSPTAIGPEKGSAESIREMLKQSEESERIYNEHRQRAELIRSKLIYPISEGVYGTVDENFELVDEKYREAVFTILGGRSKFVICEDDLVASRILKGSDRRISCIPLNRIVAQPNKPVITKGVQALDVIRYNPKYEKAFKHLMGGYYIFDGPKSEARQCCFDKKVLCVMLDGTVYDPRGTLTGGKAVINTEVTRMRDVVEAEQRMAEISKVILDEAQARELRVVGEMMELYEHGMRDMEDVKNKMCLLEKICNSEIDVHKELTKVREELVEETRREEEINKAREQAACLEAEIRGLERKQTEQKQELEIAVQNVNQLKAELDKAEKQGKEREFDDEEIEKMESRKKNLIKTTTTFSRAVEKLRDELDGLSGDFEKMNEIFMANHLKDKRVIDVMLPATVGADVLEDFAIGADKASARLLVLSEKETKELQCRVKELSNEANRKRSRITMDPKSFETLEKTVATIRDLEGKLTKLEQDRLSITRSIETLSAMGEKENQKAFEHVNRHFKKFLRYFIPNADIEINESFEIRVKIGEWKNSLTELSGGQRSIIALCLIFSMLLYRPAPFYIFDEIDAALDLSYTQGIGEIIRKEFNNAQFIIISLKNIMFENANQIYRIYIQNHKSKIALIK